MPNLKQLREKRSLLINDLEMMVSSVEGDEVRSLTEQEIADFDAKKLEIENIDATIARVEHMRTRNMDAPEMLAYEDKKATEEDEKRALENFFRGQELDVEQRRMLTSTGNNQALLPTKISETILKKLEEQCPILLKAKKFNTKGVLRLIDESTPGSAGLTPEGEKFHESDVAFNYIELRAYKVSTVVSATFELLANSEIDLGSYLLDVILTRLSRELNRLYLIGTGTNQPEGLINGKQTVELSDDLSIKDFITMQTSLNPTYLDNADWIVNRQTFQKMANLLDNTGRPYLTSDVIGMKVQYRFLGCGVVVDQNMPNHGTAGNKSVILCKIADCYAVNMVKDMTIKHLVETGFKEGVEEFAGYVLSDGKIYNSDALVVGITSGTAGATMKSKK